MVTQTQVRRIAMSLPGVREEPGRFAFSVVNKEKARGIAWVWLERKEPKKARVPNKDFLAVRVANLAQKELILAADPRRFFTEPHYNGYPAVLVRLKEIGISELRILVEDAWRCVAPRELIQPADSQVRNRAKRVSAKRGKTAR